MMKDTNIAGRAFVERFGDFAAGKPDVSCLMAAYWGDEPGHLGSALESIGAQRGVRLELVLVLDGMISNEAQSIVQGYCSSAVYPVTVVQTEENKGLASALNEGLTYCRGELIARFDADDVSDPDRLTMQLEYMNTHPNVDVLGTSLALMDEYGAPVRNKRYPTSHSAIKRSFFLKNPIAHPSVVFRRDRVLALGGYPSFRRSQDYALWGLCLVNGMHFENLPQSLVQMRTGAGLADRRGRDYFRTESEVLKFLRDVGIITTFKYRLAYTIRYLSRQFNHVRAQMKKGKQGARR
jgi:amylovoran biosynthesis glycosyltransferase AmsE